MKQLVCEMCGSNDLIKQDGVFVCQVCGTKYSVEEAKKMMVEGTVDVSGSTVKVDNTHMVDNYLEMAENAMSSGNHEESERYCNKIIEIEPTNYKAWMLKGEAAAWQSTLQNPRVEEGISAFAKAINSAPEDVKEELIERAKEQIKNVSVAMISLRGDRFAKWPDKEETAGFITDLMSIFNTIVSFLSQTGAIVPISELMAPVAKQINQAVVTAYNNVVLPEYKSERYPWPDDDDFLRYIERIGYCTDLVEKAIELCDDDDDEDIQRYNNLISLHEAAINACSYDSQYVDLSEQWRINLYSKPGYHPVPRDNRVYYKSKLLTNDAIAARRQLISQYKTKIAELESAKERKIAEEKAEKERLAREEEQKRRDEYWAEHAEEKKALEAERETILSQMKEIKAKSKEQIDEIKKNISAIVGQDEISSIEVQKKKLESEQSALGMFKGKEKKALQDQIDKLQAEIDKIQYRMDQERRTFLTQIDDIEKEMALKIKPLQDREKEINLELNKKR